MRCKRCNEQMGDEQLICPKCGYESPLMESREKYEFLLDKQRNAVLNATKSSLFVATAICFTIMALGSAASIIHGNFLGAIPAIFMIVSAIGFWMAFGSKNNADVSSVLKYVSIFDAYNNVIYFVASAISALVTLGGAAVLVLSLIGEDTDGGMQQIILFAGIVVTAIGLIFTGINLLCGFIHSSRRKCLLAFSSYAEKMEYSLKKAPAAGSYFLGVIGLLGGIGSLFTSLVSASIVAAASAAVELAFKMIEIEGAADILPLIQSFLGSLAVGLIITGASQMANGLFYILSGNWMSNTHTSICATRSFVNHENVRRLELERNTRAAREAGKELSENRDTEQVALDSNEDSVEDVEAASVENSEDKSDESIAESLNSSETEDAEEEHNTNEALSTEENPEPIEASKSVTTSSYKSSSNPDSVYDDDDYYDMYDIEG